MRISGIKAFRYGGLAKVKTTLVFIILVLMQGCKQPKAVDRVAALYSDMQVISNIVYTNVDSVPLALDAYVPMNRLGEPPWVEYTDQRKPTLLFLHGGGWTSGDKISRSLYLMPYVDKDWCVVTANYRHLDQGNLVEIIRDARSALNWIYDNADKYKFDTTKIVVSGESAGGHLALMTGLSTDETVFNHPDISSRHDLRVAAIVNWFGVVDLKKTASSWDSAYLHAIAPNEVHRDSILRIASPITYLKKESPPIMTIHGDQDKSAPYEQGVLLHEKLEEIGTTNHFLTIPGKKHGNFSSEEMTMIFSEIWSFLKEQGIN